MAEAICVIEDDVSVDKATPLLASQQRSYLKEQVWEEIFQEKCAITVQQKEIEYVEKKVEDFVSEVIQRALESDKCQNYMYGILSAVKEKELLQFNQRFSVENLLRVGSFYEGTKNSYPNEFDFIFVLAEYSAKDYRLLQKLTSDLSDLFHKELKNSISGLVLGEVFEQCSLSGLHGPASKIKLVFNEAAELRERIVCVDISAASRWHFETCLPKEIEVCYKEWIEMILKTGSALVIKVYNADHPKHETQVKVTITETEQYFAKHAMTENHRKVYRLLKYVFNGNDGANETLKRLIRRPDNTQKGSIGTREGPLIVYDLSSYTIKTLIFDHVHRCRNAEESIAECLTEVLRSLLAKFDGTKCVSVKTMLSQPLEITDSKASTVKIGEKLSILVKTAENVEQTRKTMRADLDEQIPFTGLQVDTVKKLLDLKGNPLKRLNMSTVLIILSIMVTLTVGFIFLTEIFCKLRRYTSSTNSSNKSIDVQYCCIGTKGISERWRNVTCSKSNIFSRHSDNIAENMSIGLEKVFACMALTVAKNIDVGNGDVYYAWNDVALCSGNVSKVTEEAEMCLYCNVSVEDPRDNEVFLPTPNQDSLCSGIAPCRLDELGKQVNSFLKIKALTFNGVHMHAFSNCDTENFSADANCTSNPLQTCTENTTSDGRTELCCSTSEIGSNGSSGPTDKCKLDRILSTAGAALFNAIATALLYWKRRKIRK